MSENGDLGEVVGYYTQEQSPTPSTVESDLGGRATPPQRVVPLEIGEAPDPLKRVREVLWTKRAGRVAGAIGLVALGVWVGTTQIGQDELPYPNGTVLPSAPRSPNIIPSAQKPPITTPARINTKVALSPTFSEFYARTLLDNPKYPIATNIPREEFTDPTNTTLRADFATYNFGYCKKSITPSRPGWTSLILVTDANHDTGLGYQPEAGLTKEELAVFENARATFVANDGDPSNRTNQPNEPPNWIASIVGKSSIMGCEVLGATPFTPLVDDRQSLFHGTTKEEAKASNTGYNFSPKEMLTAGIAILALIGLSAVTEWGGKIKRRISS